MKEDNVVTAAALILQESTKTEKCWGEEQLLLVHTPTRPVLRCVQSESEAKFCRVSFHTNLTIGLFVFICSKEYCQTEQLDFSWLNLAKLIWDHGLL